MTEKERKQTTIVGVYSERYKGGPVVEAKKEGLVYLVGTFQQNSKYEGKKVEVTGVLSQDTETVVGPYKKGEPISQGWAESRTVLSVKTFKVLD